MTSIRCAVRPRGGDPARDDDRHARPEVLPRLGLSRHVGSLHAPVSAEWSARADRPARGRPFPPAVVLTCGRRPVSAPTRRAFGGSRSAASSARARSRSRHLGCFETPISRTSHEVLGPRNLRTCARQAQGARRGHRRSGRVPALTAAREPPLPQRGTRSGAGASVRAAAASRRKQQRAGRGALAVRRVPDSVTLPDVGLRGPSRRASRTTRRSTAGRPGTAFVATLAALAARTYAWAGAATAGRRSRARRRSATAS